MSFVTICKSLALTLLVAVLGSLFLLHPVLFPVPTCVLAMCVGHGPVRSLVLSVILFLVANPKYIMLYYVIWPSANKLVCMMVWPGLNKVKQKVPPTIKVWSYCKNGGGVVTLGMIFVFTE